MVTDKEAVEQVEHQSATAPGADQSGWLHVNSGPASGPLATADGPREWFFQGADEHFRSIYTRAATGFDSEVLAICSSISGEGKTTLSVGLAVTIAQDFPERRVLLVETDFERPVLADDFGVAATPGLVDCVVAGGAVQDAYRTTFLDNLHLMPVGRPTPNAGRVLRSVRIAAVMDALRRAYDLIILDVPPILVNSDAVLLTDLADSIICVIRAGVTPMDVINQGLSQLDPEKLRGVVLNGSESAMPGWLRRVWGA